jgi:hypothetical protein
LHFEEGGNFTLVLDVCIAILVALSDRINHENFAGQIQLDDPQNENRGTAHMIRET